MFLFIDALESCNVHLCLCHIVLMTFVVIYDAFLLVALLVLASRSGGLISVKVNISRISFGLQCIHKLFF
jgi:hypothetical protein